MSKKLISTFHGFFRSPSTPTSVKTQPQEIICQATGDEEKSQTTSSSANITSNSSTTSLCDRLRSLTNPFQPKVYEFPQRLIGGKQRRFQTSWFDKYQWLHYNSCTDAVFCYICVRDHFSNPILPKKAESALTTTGFTNWKKAMTKDRFRSHDISQAHKEATLHVLKIPTEYSNEHFRTVYVRATQ